MSAQQIIETATSVGAAQFGTGEAGKIFRDKFKNSPKVMVDLRPSMISYLKERCDFPFTHIGSNVVTNDHAILVAMRELIRQNYENEFHINDTNLRTLAIGSAAREMKQYYHNPHINFHIHGKESKDTSRIVTQALSGISKNLKKKAGKKDPRIYVNDKPECFDYLRPEAKTYFDFKEIMRDYFLSEGKNLPKRFTFETMEAQQLLFEDSIYNFEEKELVDLLQTTGAHCAYGYALYPLEMIDPDIPKNNIYDYREESGKSYLTFRHGYCNGYVHSTKAWRTLIEKPVLTNGTLYYSVEFTSRVGPMAVFKINRVQAPETFARNMELPKYAAYCKVLDIMNSCNLSTGKVDRPLKYFPVREEEFWDVFNYAVNIDIKSLNVGNLLLYIRRRAGGMSLVTKELLAPWDLEKKNFYKLALAIEFQAKLVRNKTDLIRDQANIGSFTEKILKFIRNTTREILWPITYAAEWLFQENLVGELIVFKEHEFFQIYEVKKQDLKLSAKHYKTKAFAKLYLDYEANELPDCAVCAALYNCLGKQKMSCKDGETLATFELTDAQVQDLKTTLIDNDKDPQGLKSVKERAAKAMPTAGFKRNVKIHNISGGPGTGKSYIIRALADETDLVLAPFTKLKPDYENLINEQGDEYDLIFKTTHRAMEMRGHKRIFVDEWTSFPYEFLACIIEVNGAEEVFLVGDEKQTRVQEPDEGLYIGNYVDVSKLATHELHVNFRNPQFIVALLNDKFGYHMEAFSSVLTGFEVRNMSDGLPMAFVGQRFALSSAGASHYTQNERNTVRATQGGTFDKTAFYVSNMDANLIGITELLIVAVSRHKEMFIIMHDGDVSSQKFLSYFSVKNPLEYVNTHIKPINIEETKSAYISHPILDKILVNRGSVTLEEHLPITTFKKYMTKLNSLINLLKKRKDFSSQEKEKIIKNFKVKTNLSTTMSEKFLTIIRNLANHTLDLGKWLGNELLSTVNCTKQQSCVCLACFSKIFDFSSYVEEIIEKHAEMEQIPGRSITEPKPVAKPRPRVSQPDDGSDSDDDDDDDGSFRNIVWPAIPKTQPGAKKTEVIYPKIPRTPCKPVKVLKRDDHSQSGTSAVVNTDLAKGFDFSLKDDDYVREFLASNVDFSAKVGSFLEIVPGSVRISEVGTDLTREKKMILKSPSDSYKIADTLINNLSFDPEITSLNLHASQVVFNQFRTGVADVDLLVPINARGHINKNVERYYAFGCGIGFHFSPKKPLQTLQVLAARYFNPKPSYRLGYTEKLLARDLVMLYFREHMNEKLDMSMFDETNISMAQEKFLHDAKTRHYVEKSGREDLGEARVVNFHLKGIMKPKLLPSFDAYKAGQGISAMSADALIFFMTSFRILADHSRLNERAHVLTDNGMDEATFIRLVLKQFANVPAQAMNGVTDGVMFDSQQNDWTQTVEKEYWHALGASTTFLDLYFSFRKGYKIRAPSVASGQANEEKCSGFPDTKEGNGVVSKVLSNSVLRGEGPVGVIYKGDDLNKRQCKLAVDETMLMQIHNSCPLRLKVAIQQDSEFCGLTVTSGIIAPSLFRRLDKIVGHRYRDHKHFLQYQESLRNFMTLVEEIGYENVISANMAVYECTYDEAQSAYFAIDSYSHINAEQFFEASTFIEEADDIPRQNDFSPYGVVFENV